MSVFLCRWPNGDLSIVAAKNKEEAIIGLDEFGNADHADIFHIGDFAVDFKLNDQGKLELSEFGEATHEGIMEKGYPLLWKTLTSDELISLKEDSEQYRKQVGIAVEMERKRLIGRDREPPAARTEWGKRLQKEDDFPAAKADRLTEQVGKDILEDHDDDETVH